MINIDLIILVFEIAFLFVMFCVLVYATIYPFYIYPYKTKREHNSRCDNMKKMK